MHKLDKLGPEPAATLLWCHHAGAPQQPRPLGPPLQRRIRKVGAPLGVIITLGTVAGLLVILLTAVRPVGTAIGFVLSTVAVAIVVLVVSVARPLGAGTATAAGARVRVGSICRRHRFGGHWSSTSSL